MVSKEADNQIPDIDKEIKLIKGEILLPCLMARTRSLSAFAATKITKPIIITTSLRSKWENINSGKSEEAGNSDKKPTQKSKLIRLIFRLVRTR